MKSDKEFYDLFKIHPDLLKLLVPIRARATYTFRSKTVKALERRMDGCFEPTNPKDPIYVIEVQARKKDNIYSRIIIEMAMLGISHPNQEIKGVLLFLKATHDPKTKPWVHFARTCKCSLRVVYLEGVVRRLAEKEPDHPIVALFEPLLQPKKKRLKQKAVKCYLTIQKADLPEEISDVFQQVFISWMMQRFTKADYKEIFMFLADLTPLEETRAYKQMSAIIDEKQGFPLKKLKLAIQEKNDAMVAKENAVVAKDKALAAKNDGLVEIERLNGMLRKVEKDNALVEIERLNGMLRKAGIDPDS